MTDAEPDALTALSAVLAELEDAIGHDYPQAYVGVEAAVARLTVDCDEPNIGRLSYAPHRVEYVLNDADELEPYGESELLDSEWEETDSWFCRNCDTKLDGRLVATAHARGIDLSGL